MATVINGTDNTAATPALTGTDTDTGVFFPAANTMALSTGGTEQVRVDSAGNVGIGTASPATKLQVIGSGRYTSGTESIQIYHNGTVGYIETLGNVSTPIGFANGGVERMRVDSSGNLLVGTTSSAALVNANSTLIGIPSGYASGIFLNHASAIGGGNVYAVFGHNANLIGSITQNGTTAVSFNTTSDYRLKENVAPMIGALAKVQALKPVTYTWKSAPDEIGEGFIAHELAEVCPQAVTGEKDAVDENGSIKPQSIDTSFLVATLTAAIQELKAIVDEQAARIAALENPAAPTPVES
jgi:hypothetical protein